jgi:predicted Zn-ribbon and HTH transcriptional regulator
MILGGNSMKDQWFILYYECPDCGFKWEDEWDYICDSECPDCGCRNVEAAGFEDVSK